MNNKKLNIELVSVITITYGQEDYIIQAIEGVLMQKYDGHIEFIISNDNSPDSTDELIRNYFNNLNIPSNFTINYINHKQNKGVINNFIWSLNQANGDYIAICEGDDYWIDSLKLKKQVDFLEDNPSYSLCFHNAIKLYDNGRNPELFNNFSKSKQITLDEIVKKWIIPTASILFRKSILPLPEWSLEIYSGDQTLALISISKGNIFYLNSIMSIYRVRNLDKNSMTFKTSNKITDVIKEQLKLYEFYLEDPMCINKNIILKKIEQLKNELEFQIIKKKNIFHAIFKRPGYYFKSIKLMLLK